MELKTDVLDNHRKIFNKYDELLQNLIKDHEINRHKIDLKNKKSIPEYLEKFQFEISPWPVIVSRDIVEEFNFVTKKFPEVVKRVLKIAVKNDRNNIVNHLNIDSASLDLFSNLINQFSSHFLRIDLLFNNNQIKIVESNTAVESGGWQIRGLKEHFLDIVKPFLSDYKSIIYPDTLAMFFAQVYKGVEKHFGTLENCNVLLFIKQDSNALQLEKGHQKIFDRVKPEGVFQNNIIVAHDPTKILFEADRTILFDGIKISVVIIGDLDVNENVLTNLTLSHIRKKVFFLENPYYKLLENKLHFALMHEYVSSIYLTEEDSIFIQKYIPWTAQCFGNRNKRYVWENKTKRLFDILLSNKDELLIKPIIGHSGQDVYIGKFQTDKEWKRLVNQTFLEPLWITQKYYQPDTLYTAGNNGNVEVSYPVWGLFTFLGVYSGGFVRHDVSTQKDNLGVINAATGAKESPIIEIYK